MSVDLTAIDNFLFGSDSPLNRPVTELTNEMITEKEPNGKGTFDVFMGGIYSQLEREFTKNRITGAEYSRAYIALTESALSNSVQYLLAKDTAYWQAVTAQMGALKARVELEVTIQQLALNEAQIALLQAQTAHTIQQTTNLQAEYTNISKQGLILDEQKLLLVQQTAAQKEQVANTKQQTANLLAEHANITKQGNLLDKQKDLTISQAAHTTQQTANLLAEKGNITKQGNLLDKQKDLVTAQATNTTQQTANLLAEKTNITKQGNVLDEQKSLIKEQMESQRAQTLDKRTDNANVAGLIGKQKGLYSQQVDSYKRDAEVKTSKLLTDMWVTMKTVDEGLSAPTEVNNAKLNTLISNLRSRNNI